MREERDDLQIIPVRIKPGENGVFKIYDDTYDITIHCTSQEEYDAAVDKLMAISWIPVSEKLPEERKDVLFCDAEEHVYLGHWMRDFWVGDFSGKDVYWYAEGRQGKIEKVAAWMPLPEPYEEVDG